MLSATEWTASASIDVAPVRRNPTNLAMAMPMLAMNAAKMALRLPSCMGQEATGRQAGRSGPARLATVRRSSTNAAISADRRSSGARRIEDGWTVAVTSRPSGQSTNWARWRLTRKSRPSRAWAATAPRATTILGWTASISASSHGRQAETSAALGFWWMRRLPRASHLKCLTDVGDVDRRAVDARLLEGLIEQPAGRAHERAALPCPPGRRAARPRASGRRAPGPRRTRSGCPSPTDGRPCSRPPRLEARRGTVGGHVRRGTPTWVWHTSFVTGGWADVGVLQPGGGGGGGSGKGRMQVPPCSRPGRAREGGRPGRERRHRGERREVRGAGTDGAVPAGRGCRRAAVLGRRGGRERRVGRGGSVFPSTGDPAGRGRRRHRRRDRRPLTAAFFVEAPGPGRARSRATATTIPTPSSTAARTARITRRCDVIPQLSTDPVLRS